MSAAKAKQSGKSVEEFRAAHDRSYIVPKRIRQALASLGDGWEYEANFIKIAGISQTDIGRFRDEFDEHIVTTSGHNAKRVWAGTKALADKLRAMVN